MVTLQVLNYNDASSIIDLIKRVKDYTIFNNILIVDNGSTDDSMKILKNKYQNNKKIKIIETKKNGGYGYGHNFGINYVNNVLKNEYAVITSPGVFFAEDTIKAMLILAQKKKAGIVSATQKINGLIAKNAAWKIPSAYQWALIESRLAPIVYKKYHYTNMHFQDTYSKVDCVLGAMFMIDVKKFINVAGYDERMFLFGEETLIGFKFKEKGYPTYILNNYFYDHPTSTTIKKNLPSVLKQDMITHHSKLIFMKYYLKCNLFTLTIIEKFFKLQEKKKAKEMLK